MRLGKFAIQGDPLRSYDHEQMMAIQKDMVVLDVIYNRYQDAATFTAEHPAFDEIGMGESIPTYEVRVDVDDNDNMVVEFKRIAE